MSTKEQHYTPGQLSVVLLQKLGTKGSGFCPSTVGNALFFVLVKYTAERRGSCKRVDT